MTISTPDLCDQYEQEIVTGKVQLVQPIFRHYGKRQNFFGPIATVRCNDDNSLVGDMLRSEGGGRVLVVDGGASMNRSLLGDMLAQAGADNGWSGVLINGCVRDVEELALITVGVMALASIPRKTEKAGRGETGVPLSFAGASFFPGNYIYVDQTGMLVADFPL